MMSTQEYYDLLVKSASDGTFPSYLPERTQCLYRHPDGIKRCAIGVAVPDEVVNHKHELETLKDLWPKYKEYIPLTLREASELQVAHDDTCTVGWTTKGFLKRLNAMPAFAAVKKEV